MENTENTAITPKTVTELKQVTPSEIDLIAEQVMEVDKIMTQSTEELEHLSGCLNNLAYTREAYEKSAKKVRKQMRDILPHL